MASRPAFSLKGRGLKCDDAQSIDPHLAALQDDQQVQLVVMGGNTLGMGACQKLGSVLQGREHLIEADLADIFTGRLIAEIPQSLAALCTSLLTLRNLTTIDLSDNAFGGRCVDAMVPFLSSHLPLEELRLANNGLGPAGATVIAGALCDLGLKAKQQGRPSRLRKIVCGRNRCENGSAVAWGKAFEVHSQSLLEVRLYQNDIRNHGWDPIMTGLAHCSNLQVLDMWDNTATEKGSKSVAWALPRLKDLRELNLGDCLLRPRGGAMIARALMLGNNSRLEQLKLSGSEIDEGVVGLLVEFVKSHGSKLKKVELNDNFGDSEAAEELTGVWGAMKEALDGWQNGAELDELDAIIENDSDGEANDTTSEEEEQDRVDSENGQEGKKSADGVPTQAAPVPTSTPACSLEPGVAIAHASSKQPAPANAQPNELEPDLASEPLADLKADDNARSVPAAKKEKKSKEDALYDLMTQTMDILKLG